MEPPMKILTALIVFLLTSASPAFAGPRYTAAKRAADKVKSAEKDLSRKFKKLNASDKAKLKSSFKGGDADSDGVPDIIEGAIGSSSCSADSDSDGLPDGEDSFENDSDSNDDGHPDGTETQAKGSITSFADPLLTVGGKVFVVNGDTRFEGHSFSQADLQPGICVEVEGHTDGANSIADKIKREDSCD
jgi:hypothetical protein